MSCHINRAYLTKIIIKQVYSYTEQSINTSPPISLTVLFEFGFKFKDFTVCSICCQWKGIKNLYYTVFCLQHVGTTNPHEVWITDAI